MKDFNFDYETRIPPGFYDKIYRRGAGLRYCWHDLKFQAVAAHVGRPVGLLDVGCGPGTFVGNYLGDIEALGIDVSGEQIAYAKQAYSTDRHRFSTQSLDSLVASGACFETITMIELIEHLPPGEALRLLRLARKLLMPEGTLVITTPNYRSLWPLIEWGVNFHSSVSYEEQHVNKYVRSRLLCDLKDAGYNNLEVKTVVGLAPFMAGLGLGTVRWFNAIENRVRHFGFGNLLLATANP